MPRYFFNVIDGLSLPDPVGTELPDIGTARALAIKTSGEILRDMGAQFWNGKEWEMEVSDESGQVLFALRFSAVEFPGT